MSSKAKAVKRKIYNMIPIICSGGLVIRKYQLKDIELFYEYTRDPELSKHLLCKPTKSKADAERFIRGIREKYYTDKETRFIIADLKTNKLVGAISLYIVGNKNTVELGYWIGKPYWGQGYMTNVIISVIERLKTIPEIEAVQIIAYRNNLASIKVAEKAGLIEIESKDDNVNAAQILMGLKLTKES